MEFGHIGFEVSDLQKSKAFYQPVMDVLGLKLKHESDNQVRWGTDERTVFYCNKKDYVSGPFHIAFEVDTREEVDAFYQAAIQGGGEDNGAPGVREDYSPTYYAAFVIDPDGNNFEVVCR